MSVSLSSVFLCSCSHHCGTHQHNILCNFAIDVWEKFYSYPSCIASRCVLLPVCHIWERASHQWKCVSSWTEGLQRLWDLLHRSNNHSVNTVTYAYSLKKMHYRSWKLTFDLHPHRVTVKCVIDWVSSPSSAPVLSSIRDFNRDDAVGVSISLGHRIRGLCVSVPVEHQTRGNTQLTCQSHWVSCEELVAWT